MSLWRYGRGVDRCTVRLQLQPLAPVLRRSFIQSRTSDSIAKPLVASSDHNSCEGYVMRVTVALFVLLIFASCTPIDKGNEYLDQGEYELAIEAFNEAIRDNPEFFDAYNGRGIAYSNIGEYQHAIEDFNTAIRLQPEIAIYYSNRGLAYDALGQHGRAIEDHDKAIEMSPYGARAQAIGSPVISPGIMFTNRGFSYQQLGLYEKALEDYDESLRLDSHEPTVLFYRGSAYVELGNYELAIEDLSESIAMEPSNAYAFAYRAMAFIQQGREIAASEDLEQAVELGIDESVLSQMVAQVGRE